MIRYKLVQKGTDAGLSEEIERLLNDGWELYGTPFRGLYVTDEGYTIAQAVTKNEITRPSSVTRSEQQRKV